METMPDRVKAMLAEDRADQGSPRGLSADLREQFDPWESFVDEFGIKAENQDYSEFDEPVRLAPGDAWEDVSPQHGHAGDGLGC